MLNTYIKLDKNGWREELIEAQYKQDTLPRAGIAAIGAFSLSLGLLLLGIGHIVSTILAVLCLLISAAAWYLTYVPSGSAKANVVKVVISANNAGNDYHAMIGVVNVFSDSITCAREAYSTLSQMCGDMCENDAAMQKTKDALKVVADVYWDNVNQLSDAAPLLNRWQYLDKDSKRRLKIAADKAMMRGDECTKLISMCSNRSVMASQFADVHRDDEQLSELHHLAEQWTEMLGQVRTEIPLELTETAGEDGQSVQHAIHANLKKKPTS